MAIGRPAPVRRHQEETHAMKRLVCSLAAAAAMLVATHAPLGAQMLTSPFRFGITGGATVPLGNLADRANTGWNAGALLDVGLPLVPIGFRLDVTWQQLDPKRFSDGSRIKNRFIAGTANVLYTFNSMAPTKFYLIGGLGGYGVRTEVAPPIGPSVTGTETKFGINAGAGFRFQLTGFSTFIEARWHDVFTSGPSSQFIPINVGVTF
jgi:opacity protein-like surface antigen